MKNLIKLFCLVIILALFVIGQNQLFAKSDNSSSDNSRGKSEASKDNGQDNNQGSSKKGKSEQSSGADHGKGQGRITKLNMEEEKEIEVKREESSRGGQVKVKKLEKIEVRAATESAHGKRHAIQGVISAIDGSTITLVHQIHRSRVYKVLYNNTTLIKSKESSGSASLRIGLRIIVVGDLNSQGVLVAKRIFVIPGKATGIFRRLPVSTSSASATPSASVAASPSASISPSPTSSPSI